MTLDDSVQDVRAVMDAAGCARAALFGAGEAAATCVHFALAYPESTAALVLFGASARTLSASDYPHGREHAFYEQAAKTLAERWGEPILVEAQAPSAVADQAFSEWLGGYYRTALSPRQAVATLRLIESLDIRNVLGKVRSPTLVLHRTGDRVASIEAGLWLAEHIAGAQFVELPGSDHLPYVGHVRAIVSEVESFLASLSDTVLGQP
jgi:pimeloyl-ACP methyl ester carboxylesterase